jgi:hypothetical protein
MVFDQTNWVQIQKDLASSEVVRQFLLAVNAVNPFLFGGLVAGLSQAATRVGYTTLLITWQGLDAEEAIPDVVREKVQEVLRRNNMPERLVELFSKPIEEAVEPEPEAEEAGTEEIVEEVE